MKKTSDDDDLCDPIAMIFYIDFMAMSIILHWEKTLLKNIVLLFKRKKDKHW